VWYILNGLRVLQRISLRKGDETPNLETPHSPENQGEEVADFGLYKTQFLNGKSSVRDCWHDMKQLNGIVTRCRIL
jgi:hypothetical protein